MKNKKGFTLVELIVVIAIMGVMLAAVGISVNSLGGQRVKTASKNVYNMLGTAQTIAMSKGNTLFGLIYEDGTYQACIFYRATSDEDYTVIQSTNLNKVVGYSFECADGTKYTIGDSSLNSTYSNGVIICIDRSTGKFDGTYQYTGDLDQPKSTNTVDKISNCTHIYIGGESKLKDIVLVSLTGKFYYNE